MEVYWSIKKAGKYHIPVHCIYDIIQVEIWGIISKNTILQMAFKAINETEGPDGFVLTLFVFSAYPCIVIDSLPLPLQL